MSTPEQRKNNSLTRQEESVNKAAEKLGVEIVRVWSGDASSKVGKNVRRKDLVAAHKYCKENKKIGYLIVDEVDRFMRSTAEMFYWIVSFREVGVRVHFATNPELNNDDAKARLMLSLDAFKSEGSNEERQHKSINGHQKAIREGRYTFHPKPGYRKGVIAGVHEPHPVTFEPLRQAFLEIVSGKYTPKEALERLNESRFNTVHAKWKMDKFRHFAKDLYYSGVIEKDLQVKERNEFGLHTPMLSPDEQKRLIDMFSKTIKLRGHQKQYNPEFPMNKIMTCEDCGNEAKFSGSRKSNGFNRKKTTYYLKYNCRLCNKGYHRDVVHDAITKRLNEVTYSNEQREDFIAALKIVWEQKHKDRISQQKSLRARIEKLNEVKSGLLKEMVLSDESLKADLREEVNKVKIQIQELEKAMHDDEELQEDLINFVKFGLEYTNKLKDDWWQLNHEERVRCQILILPGGISFNSERKVGTTKISPIYSLDPNKKALREDRKALMVELAGSAPASISLR